MREKKLLLGGQAVMEGVMIKSPHYYAVSVRKKAGIATILKRIKPRKAAKIPFLRGVVTLWDMLIIGMKAMIWSSDQAAEGEGDKISKKELILTITLALAAGIGIFIFLPLAITQWIFPTPGILFNLIDGIVRILFFLGYLAVIAQLKDIKRVFEYHGAEHMAVHCHEAKRKLSIGNIKAFSPIHPRCGTSFLVIVFLLSILIFSVLRSESLIIQFGGRILLIPVIAGVSYELLRIGAAYERSPLMRLFILPGLGLQKITTRFPKDDQIEVAMQSVARVREAESKHSV